MGLGGWWKWLLDGVGGAVRGKQLTMGVGLQPLEFTECLADSPHFRENLQRHEKELERTSQQIKRLVKEVKDVVQAAKRKSSPSSLPNSRCASCTSCSKHRDSKVSVILVS